MSIKTIEVTEDEYRTMILGLSIAASMQAEYTAAMNKDDFVKEDGTKPSREEIGAQAKNAQDLLVLTKSLMSKYGMPEQAKTGGTVQ